MIRARRGRRGQVLIGETLDLEQLGRPKERLEPLRLDVHLAAVDVPDETLHVDVGRVPEDDDGVRARIPGVAKMPSIGEREQFLL